MKKAKILVADDELQVREIISRYLISQNYECATACDGNDALSKIDAEQFDLVLLDIKMPGKSGIEILKELQTKYPDTATIMVTAITDIDVGIKSMRNGAYDYLIKPIDFKMLSLSIERALGRRKLILENKEYRSHLEKKIKEQTDKIQQSFIGAIHALVEALEVKNTYSKGHSELVAEIAVATAKELGMSEEKIEKIRLAALIHDIGQIGIRESVLNKRNNLTAEEYEHLKSHCTLAKQILQPIIDDDEILDMIVHHHERYDGTGYPDRLSAAQLSREVMVLAIAEAYATKLSQNAMPSFAATHAAMHSKRPHRQAPSLQAIKAEFENEKGKQFDPLVVDALFEGLKRHNKTLHK